MDPLLDPNVTAEALLSATAPQALPSGDVAAPTRSVTMLELRHKQGHYNAIPYMHLLWIAFDPSVGIKLHFATHTLRIRGRNLRSVYEQLVAQTCSVLQEIDPGDDKGEDDATLITGLIFRPIRRGRDIPIASEGKKQSSKQERRS